MADLYCNSCKNFVDGLLIRDSECGDYVECPVCGSNDFEEAAPCRNCGEDIISYYVICEECKWELRKELNAVMKKYGLSDIEFIEVLNEYIEDCLM